jgi:plastocyanin
MRVRFLIAAAATIAACGSDSTSPTAQNKTVDIYTIGDAFSPTFVTLAVGDTARWNFTGGSDGLGHNIRFNPRNAGAPADVNVFKTGTATRVFNAKGTFPYDCDVHPGMRAEIIVE